CPHKHLYSFSSRLPPHPRSTLFPYTTLFRSTGNNDSNDFIDIGSSVSNTPRRAVSWLVRWAIKAEVGGRLIDPYVAFHEAKSGTDRKSTRLNSSHLVISYAVFCLKKKKKTII